MEMQEDAPPVEPSNIFDLVNHPKWCPPSSRDEPSAVAEDVTKATHKKPHTLASYFAAQRLDVGSLMAIPPAAPDHVLHGLPAGAVGCLVGPGGSGKTNLGLLLAVGLAIGRGSVESFGLSGKAMHRKPGKVVFVTAEESKEEMHRRLYQLVDALQNQPAASSCSLSRSDLVGLLHEYLDVYPLAGANAIRLDSSGSASDPIPMLKKAAHGARLVIVDPLRQFHSQDENDAGAMTAVVQRLQRFAHHCQCGVLVMHHTNKQSTFTGQGDMAGASRGSAALTDAVRLQLNLSRVDAEIAKRFGIAPGELDRHMRLDVSKANYIGSPEPLILRRGEFGLPTPIKAPKRSSSRGA